MPLPPAAAAALDAAGLAWQADAPLHKRVWWRVGGPADALVTVRRARELQRVLEVGTTHGLAVTPIGAGSNVLVSDRGIRGLVVLLAGELADTAERDGCLEVGAGLRDTVLLHRAARAGWAGLECLAGVPGTVGGAVAMNAGTSLGEIGDRVVWVEVVGPDGLHRLDAAGLHFGYRTATLPPGTVVSRVALRLDGDADASAARAADFLSRRKATQPLDQPSCGSTFTNPPGDHAGRLIEAAGLKGYAIGGAHVSAKHANFVLNTGTATAADLDAVIRHVQEAVAAHAGVRLAPEVRWLGDWG